MREVPIPPHITILFVEQEIIGDDTLAIDSVLKADVWRDHLLKEQASLDKKLAELESEAGDSDVRLEEAKDEISSRLTEVHARLAEMEAESGPARAAALLAGLGFSEADQSRPTKSFSGGWRMRLALARALFVKVSNLWGTVAVSCAHEICSPRFSYSMSRQITVRAIPTTLLLCLDTDTCPQST